ITHLLTRKISTLSGGEKQKINLLSILLTEPEVLLLDEPTAFLDADSAQQIIEVLKIYATDKTVIIIDHNQHYYKNFVSRIINIANNQIEEINLDSYKWHNEYPTNQIPHNSNDILLNIQNLNFAYKDAKDNLLNNISLKVHKGEIAVISGKNGNGKSTLLKLIAKLIPSQNSIFLQNKDITNIKQKEYWQQVSLLWQNPENHFLFNSVAEELKDNPELINTFDLTEQIQNNPYCLSEGQKRRLSLAITLLKPRQLILLDEPTFGQDFANKVILLEIIKKLAKLGHSFIIISHDEEFNQAVAHSWYILKDSQLWRE
ncbi:MAG: ATP-binding cassette domain-containing protein, partial [Neisseriaceae bacterium]